MLRYLNYGLRQYGVLPVWAYRRASWEFLCVLKGKCGILNDPYPTKPTTLENCNTQPLKSSHLWLFPPQHDHGWYGEIDKSCEIAVFHFNHIPPALEQSLHHNNCLERSLSEEDCTSIARIAEALKPDYQQPSVTGNLRAERALIDLTLLLLQDDRNTKLPTADEMAAEKVEAAISWYTKHMRGNPTFPAIAAAVNMSPTHLRRHFSLVRNESPRSIFARIQLETACRLLADTDEKIDFIAAECGFSSASNFCRAFKESRGISPRQWRRPIPDYKVLFQDRIPTK